MKSGMEVRYLPNEQGYQRMTTGELRKAFVVDALFVPGQISIIYADADRAIIGGAVPAAAPLQLEATKQEMAAEYFNERRELGILNIGAEGLVVADGKSYTLRKNDMLYAGRGVKRVEFANAKQNAEAVFYFLSFPAHQNYPTTLARYEDAEKSPLGAAETANKRTICKYIHPGGVKSCQLVMGLTELEQGSVWNTMPPHTHQRRMEVYMYYDFDPEGAVVHLMGTPQETRNVILRNREGIISPPWSIHCGAATSRYAFVWAMGGENQEFSDMDQVKMGTLR